ncbi:right-handed parallel beta-helix repeat-containing protein [Dyadobacter diqingensis]|uniref:right-handed parallel beta-helix repeat-containing protein n=1 Tax=Dyadobacter diqingensis TaxID=2938121 RepID=UPI0020C1B691|nr:right-handed parallel beta-helix repeat-containing protein [Dyadobacter diqingensis]
MSQYLHKNTMAEMRALTSSEIASVLDNTYVGVMLHGYYAYGDTPAAITYYKSSTTLTDDQGSVIVINPSLKLEHRFSICDVAYYGLQTDTNSEMVADRNTLVINNALKIAPKVVITQPGKYWCRGNRGGEGGSYYRYEDPSGKVWWQVGDGNGSPGGINMLSNRTFEMGDGVTLKMRGTFMDAYNFITIWNKENVTIRGGTIIGDWDIDPTLNEHKRPDGTNDGGQWGYGISLQGSKNVLIENVDISKMWGDSVNLSPDYLHSYAVNSDIVMRNVKCHHSRRQGMSIDGGARLSFYNCRFTDITWTTEPDLPFCGVDLERDTSYAVVQLKDVLFFDCKFLNNYIGARTAYKPEDIISVKFDNCVFDSNTSHDYDSYTANGVLLTNCRFSYVEGRAKSIELLGTQGHLFEKCKFGNMVRVVEDPRVVTPIRKSKNIQFESCENLDVRFPGGAFGHLEFYNSIDIKVQNCKFEAKVLREEKKLIFADGVENLQILNTTAREMGHVFEVKNISGFLFNNNVVINSLTATGILEGNVEYFELCDNTISGNSYYVTNAFAPAFMLWGAGSAYGRISDNVIYKDPIFTTVGAYGGQGSGLYREYTSASDNVVVANNKTYGFTNANAFQFNAGSTNLSVSYLNQEADTTYKGIVNQSVAISTISTANATDASTTQALVNELKAKINTLITDQKTAGQIKV